MNLGVVLDPPVVTSGGHLHGDGTFRLDAPISDRANLVPYLGGFGSIPANPLRGAGKAQRLLRTAPSGFSPLVAARADVANPLDTDRSVGVHLLRLVDAGPLR